VTRNDTLIRNISDTALWAAVYRARESERPDALFRDPFAARLAGPRGAEIADTLPAGNRHTWAWVMRTHLIDRFILEQIEQGVDLVVSLAAGLDARPYRLDLPPALPWIEVDLAELLDSKHEALGSEKPVCALESVRMDLSDVSARRKLFASLGRRATRALALTEGLLIYLDPEEVAALAEDLAGPESFQRWVLDLHSPGLIRRLRRQWGAHLKAAGSPFRFGPAEGPGFFLPHGWDVLEVRSVFKSAARAGRLPFWMRLLALLPESQGRQGSSPWSGICLLERV
jgi:methyltransferase (TIGR00027 family)